jgi:hypothetical protein
MSTPAGCTHCQRKVREVIFCVVCGDWCCVNCYRTHLRKHQRPRKTSPADVVEKIQTATGEQRKETAQAA